MKIILILLFLLIILCEIDRNFYIKTPIFKYYFKSFPTQIFYGISNTIYRFYNNKKIFNVNKNIDLFLKNNKINLENEYIRNKKLEIYAHDTSKMLDFDLNYKYIKLKFFNKESENLRNFPTIQKLLQKFKNIQTCFISIINSKKTIPYHRGPYSGLLRYHFPIIVDNPDKSYIEVMGEKLFYNDSFMFDDTFPHKLVKNDYLKRIVLICDIDNPYNFFKFHKIKSFINI